MKLKTCCFTGHRKIPPEQHESIAERLKAQVVELINDGVINYIAGGALGFDTIAALIVLELKKQYPQIKLFLALPCKTQTRGWKKTDIEIYEKISKSCDECIYISDEYYRGCMHERNRRLVDCSAYCVCYLTHNSGGTAYTVKYAEKNGLTVINLAE